MHAIPQTPPESDAARCIQVHPRLRPIIFPLSVSSSASSRITLTLMISLWLAYIFYHFIDRMTIVLVDGSEMRVHGRSSH